MFIDLTQHTYVYLPVAFNMRCHCDKVCEYDAVPVTHYHDFGGKYL